MYTVIFGRSGCPYCVRAKQIAEQLKDQRQDFDFRYIDIHEEGISKADLEKTVGKPVLTVPQIFIDKEHIGGCNEFENYVRQNLTH
ncbi:Glutaredoxin, GrxA family [Hahella chejuensis KCTC 2396]|uniref:Glutaredoxin, GrxA family n=1 Tax=Hahella chejuensis (strain KCTC 2396) TaxID=349521 RepID=Q2SEA7_HAHCH|nr:GrxA family glutaredoxin [Hahella chejuensis]ABC31017.1 Glutaredoxin, GrxA family [Hahella chejuensis KCTC 2396]